MRVGRVLDGRAAGGGALFKVEVMKALIFSSQEKQD